jgi:hypothetical protein
LNHLPIVGAADANYEQPVPLDPDLFRQIEAMQEVRFHKLLHEGREAQRQAMIHLQDGNLDRAIDTLNEYLGRLASSGLIIEDIRVLSGPIGRRLELLQQESR